MRISTCNGPLRDRYVASFTRQRQLYRWEFVSCDMKRPIELGISADIALGLRIIHQETADTDAKGLLGQPSRRKHVPGDLSTKRKGGGVGGGGRERENM